MQISRSALGLIVTLMVTACGGGGESTSAGPNTQASLRAELSWQAPTTQSDGVTPLTNLAGYKVYYRLDGQSYGSGIDVGNVTQYVVTAQGVPAGRYYFAVTAYDTAGKESDYSAEGTKLISP